MHRYRGGTAVSSLTKRSQPAFTLIEMLVVIAIIGVLSTVVLAATNRARIKARNAARREGLQSLKTALELYYADMGSYPISAFSSSEPGDKNFRGSATDWIPGLVPNYISVLPHDPTGTPSTAACESGGYKGAYAYYSTGQNYILLSHCAPEGTWASTDPLYDVLRPTWAWKVCSGEPACSGW